MAVLPKANKVHAEFAEEVDPEFRGTYGEARQLVAAETGYVGSN